jgi:hypothetical protein
MVVANKALVLEAQKRAFFSGCQAGDSRRIYMQYMAMGDPAGAMMYAAPLVSSRCLLYRKRVAGVAGVAGVAEFQGKIS